MHTTRVLASMRSVNSVHFASEFRAPPTPSENPSSKICVVRGGGWWVGYQVVVGVGTGWFKVII